MIKNLGVFSFVMLLALTSCSSDDATPTTETTSENCVSDIGFFQPAKTRLYNVKQFGFEAGTMRLTVGDCNGNGYTVARVTTDLAGASQTATDLWKQDGDFLLSDAGNDGDYFSKLYKKNAQLNETWSVTRPNGSVVTHKVIDMDSLISVPAGSFHCKVYKYNTSTAINDSYIFWNDEVGQIKEDAGFLSIELKSYN